MYPKRPPEFLTEFLGVIVSQGVASEYGPAAFALLSAVVLEERREGFRIAARFWDCDMMRAAGIRSHRHLWSIRQRLTSSGWLHYVPGHRGRPACYWVLLPEPRVAQSGRNPIWDISATAAEVGAPGA